MNPFRQGLVLIRYVQDSFLILNSLINHFSFTPKKKINKKREASFHENVEESKVAGC